MPLYYFDLLDGEDFVKGEEGMDLPNISSAQMEASRILDRHGQGHSYETIQSSRIPHLHRGS